MSDSAVKTVSATDAAHAGTAPRHYAIVGAGMSGIACARTLVQAGHEMQLFERQADVGGRMASQDSPFGHFDTGAQYFTVRDARFERALETAPGLCRPWSASSLRLLDASGQLNAIGANETHWVAQPTMQTLVQTWAAPLIEAAALHPHSLVQRIAPDRLQPQRWQLHCEGPDASARVHAGFDAVLLALPAPLALALLQESNVHSSLNAPLAQIELAPCWTLMLAFPQAAQPGLTTLGPQWNAARSTHHRISWLARESSKPGRGQVERWTIQASPAWSEEHFDDSPQRVQAKLLRAFAEVTGIHAAPAWSDLRRWRHAQTRKPLGRSHLWDASASLGACGDWCLGQRVEDAFVSGLELALASSPRPLSAPPVP